MSREPGMPEETAKTRGLREREETLRFQING
jgi:hypothetical protein